MYYLQIFSSAHHNMYDLKENIFKPIWPIWRADINTHLVRVAILRFGFRQQRSGLRRALPLFGKPLMFRLCVRFTFLLIGRLVVWLTLIEVWNVLLLGKPLYSNVASQKTVGLLSVVSCSVGFACLQYSALTSRSFCSQCEMFFREGCPSGLSGLLHCCSRVQYSALTSEEILSVKHSSEKAVGQLADRLQHRVLLRSKFVLNNDHHHQCCHKVPNGGPEKVCVLYQRSENLVYGLIPFVLGFLNKSRQAGQTADLPNLTWRLYVANFLF